MEKYIALGEKASTFFDPVTKLNLVGNEIKPIVQAFLKSPRVKRFLKGGGLTLVGKEEYKEYLASQKEGKVKKAQTEGDDEDDDEGDDEGTEKKAFENMSIKQLKTHIEKSGWEKEDIEAGLELTKKAELIEYIKKTETSYE